MHTQRYRTKTKPIVYRGDVTDGGANCAEESEVQLLMGPLTQDELSTIKEQILRSKMCCGLGRISSRVSGAGIICTDVQ
jgi:hypothetical protein